MSALEPVPIRDFDAVALFAALDAQRQLRDLSWAGVARAIVDQSAELRRLRPNDHPIAASTILNMARRGDTTCQHGLLFVQWLGTVPEQYLDGWTGDLARCALPAPVPARRLRWNLKALGPSLAQARRDVGVSWAELARLLRCSPNQIQSISRARYAIGMGLAMRTVQWLGRPAADFVALVRW